MLVKNVEDYGDMIVKWRYDDLATICFVRKNTEAIATGWAVCNRTDNFCKDTGRKLSLTRALSGFPRTMRKQFWNEYFNGRR